MLAALASEGHDEERVVLSFFKAMLAANKLDGLNPIANGKIQDALKDSSRYDDDLTSRIAAQIEAMEVAASVTW